LSTDMACRLALYFGMSFDFWLNLQKAYELDCWQQRWAKRAKEEIHPLSQPKVNNRSRKHL
jgi:plasmid maintenance system antidote protein VapI